MFASLPNYIAFFSELDDKKPLNILHEIISKFDQVSEGPHCPPFDPWWCR